MIFLDMVSQTVWVPTSLAGICRRFRAIAQLGERLHGMQEVGGSNPPGSPKFPDFPLADCVQFDPSNIAVSAPVNEV